MFRGSITGLSVVCIFRAFQNGYQLKLKTRQGLENQNLAGFAFKRARDARYAV
jgi:hypothetical protein